MSAEGYKNDAPASIVNDSTALTLDTEIALLKALKNLQIDEMAMLLAGIILAPGENHVGQIGGHTVVITVTPTIDTAIYSAGDLVGGLLTLANAVRISGGKGTIQSVVLVDAAKQNMPLDIFFFTTNLPGSTLTDNAAATIVDADLLSCIGVIKILASDYADLFDNSVATKASLGLPFTAVATSIYAIIVARDAPDYVTSGDLQLKVKIYPD